MGDLVNIGRLNDESKFLYESKTDDSYSDQYSFEESSPEGNKNKSRD